VYSTHRVEVPQAAAEVGPGACGRSGSSRDGKGRAA
jgi:hypothetical protein